MMEVAGELPSLARLIKIMQEQLHSLSGKPLRMKYAPSNVENLKLSIYLAHGLLLKEHLILHVDKSWHRKLDVMTSLCYEAEDIVSDMEYKMMMLNRKFILSQKAVYLQTPVLSFVTKKVLMANFVMPYKLIIYHQRQLKRIIDEFRFHLELFLCQIPFPIRPPCKRSSPSSYAHQNVPLIGRDADRRTILDFLFDEYNNSLGVSFIGMHGVGKSALALDILNDTRVLHYFYKVLWVSLTGPFNHQEICEHVVDYYKSSSLYKDSQDINTLLNYLHGEYGPTLLVLDNLVDVTFTEWFDFQSSYLTSSRSKILITSPNNDIALVTQTTRHYLHPLSYEICEQVIKRMSDVPLTGSLSCSAEIESLAKKCHGLPIVANFLGLQFKDESQRMALLNKDLWEVPEFKEEIWPILTSTYTMLEPNLKKCFAYMSLFHRDYHIEMGDLIQLWIAEGFVEWPDKSSLEQVCNDYLRIFKRWLIFLPSDNKSDKENNIVQDGRKYCEIHQFTHDLAKLVSSNTCFCLDDETRSCVPENNIRHLSLSIQNPRSNFWKEIKKLTFSNSSLRSFLPLNAMKYVSHIPTDFFKSVPYLRVLSLNKTEIHKIPYSISVLKSLRYLDVSETFITELPEELSKLSCLQILKLKNCLYLKHLPRKFKRLITLRHIDWEIHDISRLISMPSSIGCLTSLQRLPLFRVENEKGFRIEELKNMVHLQGSIWIKNLENVKHQKEAEAAELSSKMSLESLELEWSPSYSNARNATDVLTALQPPKNLKALRIVNYVGLNVPQWLSQLKKLRDLAIVDCLNLTSLPSFENLTSLVHLEIIACSKLSYLPNLPPSVGLPIVKKCDLLDPSPKLGTEDQHLPTSSISSSYKIFEEDTYYSKDLTEVNNESRAGDSCEITQEEPIESKLSAVEEIVDTSKETESKVADDTGKETESKTGFLDLLTEEQEIEESSSPIGITNYACEITEVEPVEPVESESSIEGRIYDTGKHIEGTNVVRNLFREKLKQISLADNEMEYHLEAEEEMRLLFIIFSRDYDFEEESLIQLWLARGFLKGEKRNCIGQIYFQVLFSAGYILSTGKSFTSNKDKYKANVDMCKDELASLMLNEWDLANMMLKEQSSSSKTVLFHKAKEGDLHLSWVGDDFEERIPTPLRKNFKNLKALFICKNSSTINRVPQYVFFALGLQILHLGGTRITNLPSSIGNLVELRYLDLSYTLIDELPDNVQCLSNLQTLKLDNCERLLRLPEEIRKLTSLECLELDVIGQLTIMPRGMGSLTKLETLSAFIVHNDEGRSIKELKNMNNLKGSFCISKLENVMDPHEAKEASLKSKEFLKELDLRWSDKHGKLGSRDVHHDDKILELLHPNSDLKQLCISCYGGNHFPHWISSPSFYMLESITLFKCDNAELLPSLGQLPSLKSLSLMELNNVEEIGKIFRGLEDDFIGFPSLETLEIIGLSELRIWKDAKERDYKSLCKIVVERCPKLEAIPSSFFKLHNLRHMEILHCSALTFSPVKELPTSLSTLIIEDCPLLVKELKKRKAKQRLKFKRVQDVWINQEAINGSNRGKFHFIKNCFAP